MKCVIVSSKYIDSISVLYLSCFISYKLLQLLKYAHIFSVYTKMRLSKSQKTRGDRAKLKFLNPHKEALMPQLLYAFSFHLLAVKVDRKHFLYKIYASSNTRFSLYLWCCCFFSVVLFSHIVFTQRKSRAVQQNSIVIFYTTRYLLLLLLLLLIILLIIIIIIIIYSLEFFTWSFTGVLVTPSLLKSPVLLSVFWPFSIM